MNLREYFLAAIAANSHLHKDWILCAFGYVDPLATTRVVDYPYPLARDANNNYVYRDPHSHEWVVLEGVSLQNLQDKRGVLQFAATLQLQPGDLPNVTQPVETTYGTALFNALCLVYPFGAKIPYMAGRIQSSDVEAVILKNLTDTPTKPTDLTVDEYLKFGAAMGALTGLTQLCVPSATVKSMTCDPRMRALRDQLLEENKDHLDDPAVIAKIDAALVVMDKAWIKGDPAEGFYLKPKSYDMVRKRMFGMMGATDPFGDGTTVQLIKNSLNDGWDIKDLPNMISALREGSFSRGQQTEQGGTITKEINRYCTNFSITEPDCGTTLGLITQIDEYNKRDYIGKYVFVGGKEIKADEVFMEQAVGSSLEVRSPMYCKTPGVDFCAHCCGENLAETPNAIGSYISDVGSAFLLTFLAAAHGQSLHTARWNKERGIV